MKASLPKHIQQHNDRRNDRRWHLIMLRRSVARELCSVCRSMDGLAAPWLAHDMRRERRAAGAL